NMVVMNARGVLVSCDLSGTTSTKYSGILLHNTWILTTGSILNCLIHNNSNLNIESPWKNLLKSVVPGSLVRIHNTFLQNTPISFSALCPAVTSPNQGTSRLDTLTTINKSLMKFIPKYQSSKELWDNNKKLSSSISSLASHSPETHTEYKCDLKYIWKSPLVIEAVDSLLSSWTLGSTSGGNDDADIDAESEIAKHLLPMFLIFKLNSNKYDGCEKAELNDVVQVLQELFEQDEDILKRGRMTVVESTPFGNSLFYNSLTEGIISNVVGPGNCLILTDARTALGCEGGPIFVLAERDKKSKVYLIGMVVCSLSWWRGEWVGFTLGVALKAAVHHCIHETTPSYSISSLKPSSKYIDKLGTMGQNLVLVRCGVGWGSGIVIDADKGVILTCSHVVRKAHNNPITIYWKDMKKPAKLLFRSKDGIAYDVAILHVEPGMHFQSASFSSRIPKKGEPVIAAGFPLFSEDNIRPTVTRGIVAHVSNPAAMLQTTCCVQSGASGGAVFWSTGELMGLISCNTQDVASGALYPNINMAVPICMLETHLHNYIKTGDIKFLNNLESPDPAIQRLWKLQSLNNKL
ncbi:hypothetical protein L9F63_013334, partial [Diploptera punctata]